MSDEICNICCEKYNKTIRRPIPCRYCNYSTCYKCQKTYLFNSYEHAHCMKCKNQWTRENLDDIFPKSFVNGDYKKHREVVLYEQEKSMFPETMIYVEAEKIVRNQKEEINKLYTKRTEYYEAISDLERVETDISDKYFSYCDKRLEILRQIANNDVEISHLSMMNSNITNMITNNNIVSKEKKKFIRACPAEGCRGFLSTAWKCGLCDVWVCPDCLEIKSCQNDDEHVCKPENIETAKLLAKDTKPCPTCASLIFKLEGCDQMFCVQCYTAFSWKTGFICTGRIHNPHYYEYLRKNGGIPREIGDIPCGGMPNMNSIRAKLTTFIVDVDDITLFSNIVRCYHHIYDVELNRNQENRVADNRDLRIKYILSDIDEETFKRTLYMREKTNEKKREFNCIWQMFCEICVDVMRRFLEEADEHNIESFRYEFYGLREYVNNLLKNICKRYKIKEWRISDKWFIIRV